MPGFLGKLGNTKENNGNYSENKEPNLIVDKKVFLDFYIERRTLNKFNNDKIFNEDDRYFILTEGIIVNKSELLERYQSDVFLDTIVKMYESQGETFFNDFRGSFSGVFYDKKKNKKIIYTNHIGDKHVYYTKGRNNNELIFGTEINYLIDYYKYNSLEYEFEENAAYFMLTYGYMLKDKTFFKQFKRLLPGHYIIVEGDEIQIKKYYEVDNTPLDEHSEENIIDKIDNLFRKAVKRGFEKNKEYGYKHLVALSGGLDSRMVTWVAHDMGYSEDIVNFTFSQSGYLDETIAKEIAGDLGHEWIFKSLDNGLFLKLLDDVVQMSYGNALYYGMAHGKSCLDLINQDKFGVIFTGQVGGIIKGYYNRKNKLTMGGYYSSKLLNKLNFEGYSDYDNQALFELNNRQFNGTLQGNLSYQQRGETYSPFLDIDLIEYALKIPDHYQENELFFKWMETKYQKSTEYIWENTKSKVTARKLKVFGKEVILRRLPFIIANRIFKKGLSRETKNHMNPIDYWYKNNQELKIFMDNYFNENIFRLDSFQELKSDCKYLYNNGNGTEKTQVLTVLSVLKNYFS